MKLTVKNNSGSYQEIDLIKMDFLKGDVPVYGEAVVSFDEDSGEVSITNFLGTCHLTWYRIKYAEWPTWVQYWYIKMNIPTMCIINYLEPTTTGPKRVWAAYGGKISLSGFRDFTEAVSRVSKLVSEHIDSKISFIPNFDGSYQYSLSDSMDEPNTPKDTFDFIGAPGGEGAGSFNASIHGFRPGAQIVLQVDKEDCIQPGGLSSNELTLAYNELCRQVREFKKSTHLFIHKTS